MTSKKIKAMLGAMLMAAIGVQAAEATKAATPQPAIDAKSLFPDETLCKGKGIEVKRSKVDEAFVQYKANLTARGQVLPESKRDLAESQLLDRLVITQLLVNRATEEDKKKARTAADKFVASTKQQAGSDESFQRQLGAMNFTAEQFDAQVLERAICEEVVDRELRSHVNITDEQLKKFYDENGEQFERPETVRAAHILLATRDVVTGQEVSEETKKERRQQIDKILDRAKKGEEFAALAREYSEDPASKNAGGEYTFARGQFRNPEFESAAFALKTNEISGVITTAFGYHIIKLYEKMPAQKLELAKVKDDLKDGLSRREVQEKLLPDYLKSLKKEANLQYLNGATPPPEVSDEKTTDKPIKRMADFLILEYKENEVAADEAYKGKVIVITGVIRDIGKGILDTPFIIVMGQGSSAGPGVMCMFPKAKKSPVADRQKGESVTVRGRVAGKKLVNIVLEDCQFE